MVAVSSVKYDRLVVSTYIFMCNPTDGLSKK